MHSLLCVKNLANDTIFEACISLINIKNSSADGDVTLTSAKVKVSGQGHKYDIILKAHVLKYTNMNTDIGFNA